MKLSLCSLVEKVPKMSNSGDIFSFLKIWSDFLAFFFVVFHWSISSFEKLIICGEIVCHIMFSGYHMK